MQKVHRGLVATLLMLATPLAAQTPTPEATDAAQADVVMIAPDRNGHVILINPELCRQIGPACDFLRVRAHCQLLLRHMTVEQRQTQQAQRAADQCAALNAPPQAVLAMWSMLSAEPDDPQRPDNDNPQDRAHRICTFALQTGNWAGPAPCP